MTEIEIKARVCNRDDVVKKLNVFAAYKGRCIRDDTYYGLINPDGTYSKKKIRIRKETSDSHKRILVTYKRKELHHKGKTVIEVNDEKECEVSDSTALEAFLKDFNFEATVKKHKEVEWWTYENATLELCNVEHLGNFLEIEILAEGDSESLRNKTHEKLEKILLMTGLSETDVEERPYTELLQEKLKAVL